MKDFLLSLPLLGLVLGLGSSCSVSEGDPLGGQAGDDGSATDPPKPEPGPGPGPEPEPFPDPGVLPAPGVSCESVVWRGPDEKRKLYSCSAYLEGADAGAKQVGEFSCDCAGDEARSNADDCESAILDACGEEAMEATFCEDEGVCWHSEDDGAFDCRCGDSKKVESIGANSCDGALFNRCADACNIVGDQCVPGDEELTWTCALGQSVSEAADDELVELTGVVGCQEATLRATHPRCGHRAGLCYAYDKSGLTCTCAGDTQKTFIKHDNISFNKCWDILEDECGAEPVQATIDCTRESKDGKDTGKCTLYEFGRSECSCGGRVSESGGEDRIGWDDSFVSFGNLESLEPTTIDFSESRCEELLSDICGEDF